MFNVLSEPRKKSFKCDKDAIAKDLRAIACQLIEDMVSQSQMLQLISQLNQQCMYIGNPHCGCNIEVCT